MNYSKLTNEEKLLVNSEVAKDGKNFVVALLLTLFLGTLGIHRFYLNRSGSGIAMLILTIFGWLTVGIIIGLLPLAIVSIWVFIDLFLISGIVTDENKQLEELLAGKIIASRRN